MAATRRISETVSRPQYATACSIDLISFSLQICEACEIVSTAINGNGRNAVAISGVTTIGLYGNPLSSGGAADLFLSTFNSAGSRQWTKQMGSGNYTMAIAVTATPLGNWAVCGKTNGGVGGQGLIGVWDAFYTLYDQTGTNLWTVENGTAGGQTFCQAIVPVNNVDNAVYLVGQTDAGLNAEMMIGTQDIFVSKYDNTGLFLWTKQLGGSGTTAYGNGAALRSVSSGDLYVAGWADGLVGLNSGIGGVQDMVAAMIDKNGVWQWSMPNGANAYTTKAYGVIADPSGNAYFVGETDYGINGETLTGSVDMFAIKYDATGAKK